MQESATLLGVGALPRATGVPVETLRASLAALEPWFESIKRFDGAGFDRELDSAWAEVGGLGFIDRYTAPFVHELGRYWALGQISVAQEHFASERLSEFLVQHWRAISDVSQGPTFICATLTGEQHVLGLHMAALALALTDARIIFLGANVPPADIAMAVVQTTVAAVLLSASSQVEPGQLLADTATLRSVLPSQTPIVAGGTGFRRTRPAGASVFESFGELQRWRSGQGKQQPAP